MIQPLVIGLEFSANIGMGNIANNILGSSAEVAPGTHANAQHCDKAKGRKKERGVEQNEIEKRVRGPEGGKKIQSIIGFEHLSLDILFYPQLLAFSSNAVSLLEAAKEAGVPLHDRDGLLGRRKTISDAIALYFDVRSNPGYKSLQLENVRQLLRAALDAPRDDKSRQTMLKLHELSLTTVLLTYNGHALVSGRKGPSTIPCKYWNMDSRLTIQFCLFEDFDVNLEQDGAYFYLTFTKHPENRTLLPTLRSTMPQTASTISLASPRQSHSPPGNLVHEHNVHSFTSTTIMSTATTPLSDEFEQQTDRDQHAHHIHHSSYSNINPHSPYSNGPSLHTHSHMLPFNIISTQSTNPAIDARIHTITSHRPLGAYFASNSSEKVDYLITVPMEFSLEATDIYWQKSTNDFTISFSSKKRT